MKFRKTTIGSILCAMLLIAAVSSLFATSAAAEKEVIPTEETGKEDVQIIHNESKAEEISTSSEEGEEVIEEQLSVYPENPEGEADKTPEEKEAASVSNIYPNSIGSWMLVRPLDEVSITDPFGWQTENFHNGVDLAAKQGSSVYAIADGVVLESGYSGAYGNCVILEHENGLTSVYAHCAELFVEQGQIVSRGERIASVGNSGRSFGAHLHFELRVNGQPVDPSQLF